MENLSVPMVSNLNLNITNTYIEINTVGQKKSMNVKIERVVLIEMNVVEKQQETE